VVVESFVACLEYRSGNLPALGTDRSRVNRKDPVLQLPADYRLVINADLPGNVMTVRWRNNLLPISCNTAELGAPGIV
jgi:hypothetical protein